MPTLPVELTINFVVLASLTFNIGAVCPVRASSSRRVLPIALPPIATCEPGVEVPIPRKPLVLLIDRNPEEETAVEPV